MKKLLSVILAAAMLLTLTACGGKDTETTTDAATLPAGTTSAPSAKVDMTLEELAGKIIELNPVEFMGGNMPLDLTDTSEDGLWNLKRFTGLDNADMITEALAFEPMMGSIAFSLVLVRVADGADNTAVAEAMKAGIDPAKWVCVQADDLKVASYGDVVMLIMVDTMSGLSAQPFVNAFQTVVGGELDFTI